MADKPVTREEKYLAYLTGDYTGEIPKPITRKEKYLYELCLKGICGEISPEEIKNAVNEYLEKNPVKPGATTEQAQQIEQNKTDIASLKTETSSLKEDISTKITKFYASSQGKTHLADSDNGKIQDMMLYGKSSQDGTPTPENPVEIKSVVNPTVKVSNKDGTQFKTVTLPYTLNAIPVNSGGNVTIDGQQYVADYVDVERGKLVRHIKEKSDTISIAVAGSVGGLGNYDYDIPFIKNVICNITNIVYEDINQGWASKQACISGSNAGELRVYLPAGNHNVKIIYELETPEEIDLTKEEVQAFKALATYYPTTNISVNSEQLDGYTVFNYPISMANGWNYVKQQIGDTRDYIYDMDARTQDTDLQATEAYVNSEYAVALTELEV